MLWRKPFRTRSTFLPWGYGAEILALLIPLGLTFLTASRQQPTVIFVTQVWAIIAVAVNLLAIAAIAGAKQKAKDYIPPPLTL